MTKTILLTLLASAVASGALAQSPAPLPSVAPAPAAEPAVAEPPAAPQPALLASPAVPPKRRPGSGADESMYDQARSLIERNQYERALTMLDRVIDNGGSRADAAMYWKGYTLSKLARRMDALNTLAALQRQFPGSAWVRDARALEVEIRQASGQSVSADIADDELKLLALRGLMQNDPETALPIIERMLAGTSSVRVKDRALFVLSQSRAPRARSIITSVATSGSNPELRMTAVRYVAMRADPESARILSDVYASTGDVDLKRTIIRSLVAANAPDRLAQIARGEKEPELQEMAIRNLGAINRSEGAELLRGIYLSGVSVETKKVVIQALSMHQNASVLVALARVEQSPELKTEMVRRLSTMRSPEARDYLVELLK